MKYLLDTNICIHLLRGSKEVAEAVSSVGPGNCLISEITKAELLTGVQKSLAKGVDRSKPVSELLDILDSVPISKALEYYAQEKIRLQSLGLPVEDFDLLIGCTAVCEGLILVSDNVGHMSRINGIRLENWVQRPGRQH